MGKIDISTLNTTERGYLVGLYYAQLKSDDERYRRKYSSNLKILAEKYNVKYSSLRNNKDRYDALFDNGRAGWHQVPLERQNKAQYDFYQAYKDYTLEELEEAVNEIIEAAKKDDLPYFSIKTKDAKIVSAILNKEKGVEFDGLNVLQDALKAGQLVFIVLGGDKPDWEPGLVGMGAISEEPYDIGYSGRNYKIKVDIRLLLDKPIKREDLVPYADTYGIIGIAPITKWEPNQAISKLSEKSAVALMRAMLELSPSIESDLNDLLPDDVMARVKGAAIKFVPVEVNYGERVSDSIKEMTEADTENEDEAGQSWEDAEEYTKKDFLDEVFMSGDDYDTLCALLDYKKNIILQGSPGVGKTYAAKRLAYSILEKKYDKCVKMVQFHQSYGYEDFVAGFRPTENGFELREGPFYDFCKKAEKDDKKHFFIIDEINRGSLSKIFGELLMLIERDKREKEYVNILYKNERFTVPENVYIIGMMNTADRSIAMIDYALRRRFGFFEMKPAFDNALFQKRIETSCAKTKDVIKLIKELNETISKDDTLGEGFTIGHSYFCLDEPIDEGRLKQIVDYEIIPLIKEYWFDEETKAEEWIGKLENVFK